MDRFKNFFLPSEKTKSVVFSDENTQELNKSSNSILEPNSDSKNEQTKSEKRVSKFPNLSHLNSNTKIESNIVLNKQVSLDLFKSNLDSFLDSKIAESPENADVNLLFEFMTTNNNCAQTYYLLAKHAKKILYRCIPLYDQIEINSSLFDIYTDSEVPLKSNGYRSILKSFDKCIIRFNLVIYPKNEKKKSFFFKINSMLSSNLKEMQSCVRLLEALEVVLTTAAKIQELSMSNDPETTTAKISPGLFIDSKMISHPVIETNLFHLVSIYQEAFLGRVCGFQYCESIEMFLTGLAAAFASYSDSYVYNSSKENQEIIKKEKSFKKSDSESSSNLNSTTSTSSLSQFYSISAQTLLLKSFVNGTRYILDPELRAKRASQALKESNVEFCKTFWETIENSLIQTGSNYLMTPVIPLNILKQINLTASIKLPKVNSIDFVTINPPQTSSINENIQIRILSSEIRNGMELLNDLKTVDSSALLENFLNNKNSLSGTKESKSRFLLLHIHGGGFIAYTSKSHEIYLKPWSKEFKIPIVSIDYSLAPEHIFPRASEECFYVYAWCLNNKDALGWTGEKIICVGDSAGGNLVTNIVQRAIEKEIRIPDALITIYTPFQLTFSLSPSRLMSIMDPVLNLAILWRCLAGYCGIDFKKEAEKFKKLLDLTETDIDDNKQSKIEDDEPKEEISEEKKLKLIQFYTILGDSIFLVEKLRDHPLTLNKYMSPLLTEDSVLSKFPKTYLIACDDPLLDDNIEMAKRLKKLNVPFELVIIDNDVPHGFLNFKNLSKEINDAYDETVQCIKDVLEYLDN